MKKLTDEELDSVFQQAAEANTPPFDPSAWQAVAQKLDAPRPIPRWKKWSPFLLAGVMLFLSGVWVGRSRSDVSTPAVSAHTDSPVIPDGGVRPPATPRSPDAVEKVGAGTNMPLAKGSIKQHVDPALHDKQFQKDGQSVSKPLVVDQSGERSGEVEKPVADDLLSGGESIVAKPVVDKATKADSTITTEIAEPEAKEMSKELEDKPGGRDYGAFIRLLASPDLSAIKFGPAELGSNFGLMGELNLSQRVSISTGIIRARKNYESFQEEAYGSSSRHLQGSCTILDVPLNITYYIPSQRKLSGYLTAGTSSYLMLREDYVYTIKSSSGDQVYPTNAIRKNNEWFKVLNLAVGLQYPVAPRWQFQLEPFIKAPLADLGERHVRLSSLGVFAGLRYQLRSNMKHSSL